ncbi:MAG TPA: pitrilysin family protein [Pyrinomonadaceae bacterium]|nr:pitrilysin family protein [Pyrinomonadaceae bacterium]
MQENIKVSRLENGLVVCSDEMPGVRSATLGFFYRVGSRNEPDELNGITHFIEHCVFKGSKKRTALDIAIEQDRLGGNLDAFTTHEETGFVVKVIDDQIERAFDLLADMLVHPRFDEADLENEQRVIIEEMKMNEDSPDELLSDIFHREFFPGHQLGMSITGTAESVKTFGHERTNKFHEQAFNAANLIIAAAGNIEHERLVELVRSSGFSRPAGGESQLKLELRTPAVAAPIFIEQRPDLEQAHMIVATAFVDARDERRYAADLLANALGGGTSSRLWQKIREERGLAYSVGASTAMYNDCGFFTVSAATSPEQVGEVLDIVIEEMRSLVRDGITADELDLMKDQTRASILLSLEDSASRAGSLAQCEMVHGRQIPVEETLAKLDAVTTEHIQTIARDFFKTDNIAFVALGDLTDLTVDRARLSIT